MFFSPATQRIWGSSNSGTDFNGTAIGQSASALGSASIALGAGVRTGPNAIGAIVAGVGGAGGPLVNDIPFSFMVGFNSDVPSLFVGQSTGAGTSSIVGIGTITPGLDYPVPSRLKLDVRGD